MASVMEKQLINKMNNEDSSKFRKNKNQNQSAMDHNKDPNKLTGGIMLTSNNIRSEASLENNHSKSPFII